MKGAAERVNASEKGCFLMPVSHERSQGEEAGIKERDKKCVFVLMLQSTTIAGEWEAEGDVNDLRTVTDYSCYRQ